MEEAVELSIPHIYKHELRFVHNGKWVSIFILGIKCRVY